MIRRVNLFGGPGAGKTTTALLTAGLMKRAGQKAAYVHEYVKSWAFRGIEVKDSDQIYIMGKQMRLETVPLDNEIQVVVSDSPGWLSLFYAERYESAYVSVIRATCAEHAVRYPEVNILLRRTKQYDPVGRYQTEEQAVELDGQIRDFLLANSIPFTERDPDDYLKFYRDVLGIIQFTEFGGIAGNIGS